ncbi:hypothetical protein E4U32_001868 [Claviceps aff. humidiphila group G2b]|nr:hypothetical protein E4U32_001868 [Claviceps aff. humidiphila group G2b]
MHHTLTATPKFSRIEGNLHHPLATATPPQGAGHSDNLHTPVNATQGPRDSLVNDETQFDFDNFPGPRPPGPTNSDAAQQDSRTRASPLPLPPRAAAPKPAAITTTHASVASQPEGPTSYTLETQVRLEPDAPTWDKDAYAIRRVVVDRSDMPLHRVPAATRTKTEWAIKPTDAPTRDLFLVKELSWSSILGASKVDRHEIWHTYVVRNCPRRLFSLTGESIDVLEAAKEEALTQTAQQPVNVHVMRGNGASVDNVTIVVSFLRPV